MFRPLGYHLSRGLALRHPVRLLSGVSVSAAMVRELRERTGSPMMECKKALSDPEVNGDMEAAMEWLRRQGVKMAAKKMDRAMNDGLIGMAGDSRKVVMAEVSAETDFVARNDTFQKLVSDICSAALLNSAGSRDLVLLSKLADGNLSVQEALTQGTATIGENIGLKDVAMISVTNGAIGRYVHNKRGTNGRCGTQLALVAVEANGPIADAEKATRLEQFADSLAMHVVGGQAMFLDGVPAEVMARERNIEMDRLMNEAKEAAASKGTELPDASVLQSRLEKKLEKVIKKMEEEQVLLNQVLVSSNPEFSGQKVSKALASLGKSIGANLSLTAAARFQVGAEKQALLASVRSS